MKKTTKKLFTQPKIIIEEELELVIPGAETLVTKIFHNRRLLLIKAILMIVFGLLALIFPELTLLVLIWYLAVMLVMIWVFFVVGSFGHIHDNKHRFMWLLEGVFDILVGFYIILNPEITLQIMLLVLSIWAVVKGIFFIINAFRLKKHVWAHLFNAIVLILFGFILFFNPFEGAMAITYVLGIFAILFGLGLTYLSFGLRTLEHNPQKTKSRLKKKKNR